MSITTNKIINEKELNTHLLRYTKKHKIISSEINKEKNEMSLTYIVEGTRESLSKMIHALYKEEWLKSSKVE